ncbi:hypothetical protein AVEN_27493-1 [Araneus ventricosus]|uniref:Uncharacterized protein n=1 Tax=Araneus ventricosus TaxID=182803 RepID=A0A4Y2E061_ARAVE|nr:hypothetical protein AVEN_27493-1 [Araneus ventricosus]
MENSGRQNFFKDHSRPGLKQQLLQIWRQNAKVPIHPKNPISILSWTEIPVECEVVRGRMKMEEEIWPGRAKLQEQDRGPSKSGYISPNVHHEDLVQPQVRGLQFVDGRPELSPLIQNGDDGKVLNSSLTSVIML